MQPGEGSFDGPALAAESGSVLGSRLAMIKPILIWLMCTIVVLGVAIVLAFRLTPWPSVAIIQQAFSRGDQASEAGTSKACSG